MGIVFLNTLSLDLRILFGCILVTCIIIGIPQEFVILRYLR
jgi:hypothetical protein